VEQSVMAVELIVSAFIGATLAIAIIGAVLFIAVRPLIAWIQEIVTLLHSMMEQQERIVMIQNALHESFSKEFELIRQPIVSLTGDTAQLRQRIERWEAQQRGEVVPELEQRQYRTVEENDAIGSRD
jgi:predicted PurR-regulated permease PerM